MPRRFCKGSGLLKRTASDDTSGAMPEHATPTATTRAAPPEDLLPILVAPHKSLKTRARPVTDADMDHVRRLVPRMFDAMYHAPGIGLAAPQIDIALRLAIVDLHPRDKPDPLVLINPEVIRVSETWATREEGCLSLPGQYAEVSRPAAVRVAFTTLDGKRREIDAEDLLAACLQHELDHLDGVLFIDHLSALKRNMILRKLAKEQKLKASG